MTKPTPYASKTQVPVQQSIAEMQKLLQKHGATNITFAWSDNSGGVAAF